MGTSQKQIEQLQKRITAVRDFYARMKRLPSYSEMLELFNLRSKQAVARVVEKMLHVGVVEKDSSGRLVPGSSFRGVRLLGDVAAGWPSPAEEELADVMSLEEYLVDNKEATFLLRVSGDSMVGAGIQPGDFVLVDRSREATTNDIVIAQVDGEYTMKRFTRRGRGVVLIAENPNYSPITADETLSIEGVVVGVVRKY